MEGGNRKKNWLDILNINIYLFLYGGVWEDVGDIGLGFREIRVERDCRFRENKDYVGFFYYCFVLLIFNSIGV